MKKIDHKKTYHPTRKERLLAAVIRGYKQRLYELNYYNPVDFYP